MFTLKIAVHNGWNYIDEPHIVQLTLDKGKSKSSSQQIQKRMSMRNAPKSAPAGDDKSFDG